MVVKSADAANPHQCTLLELYVMLSDGYDPAGTIEQTASLVAAALTAYFPEAHIVHDVRPALALYLPAWQAVHAELPAEVNVPAGHDVVQAELPT